MNASLEQAQRISRMMQRIVMVLGVIIAATALWVCVKAASDPAWALSLFKERYGEMGADAFSSAQMMALALVFLAQVAALLLALRALWRAFGAIVSSDGISVATAKWIRQSGIWFGAAALAMVLSAPLNSLIGSIGAAVGHRFISIGFESQHLLSFLLSAVLISLGHILALAADIADDNRQIV